jgi:hypothetical protein
MSHWTEKLIDFCERIHLTWSRSRDLLAYSTVHQQATLPRTPVYLVLLDLKLQIWKEHQGLNIYTVSHGSPPMCSQL